jgi:YVTN family beta-propeller protein
MPLPRTRRQRARALGVVAVLSVASGTLGGCSAGASSSAAAGSQAWVAHYAYDSQPGDTVTPVDLVARRAQAPVHTASLPAGLAATAGGTELVVTNRGFDTVSVLNTTSHTVIATVKVGLEPDAVAVASVAGHDPLAIVANFGNDSITPVDLRTMRAGRAIRVGHQPAAVAVARGGSGGAGIALVADFGSNQVTAVDLGTRRVRGNIPVGTEPDAIAVAPGGLAGAGTALVTNFGSDTITPITLAFGFPGPAIPLGANPTGIAVTPDGKTAWVSGGSSLLGVVVGQGVRGAITLPQVTEGVALSRDGSTAWVATQTGELVPVTLSSGRVGRGVHVGGRPSAVVMAP